MRLETTTLVSTFRVPPSRRCRGPRSRGCSGDLFILRAVPIIIVAPILVLITGKVDARVLLGSGFLLVAAGSWLQAGVTTAEAGFWSFAPALIITGIGSAMLFIPLSIAVLGATTPEDGPKASAFINVSTQLGGSIAVAALAILIDWRWSFHSTILGAGQTLANPSGFSCATERPTISRIL